MQIALRRERIEVPYTKKDGTVSTRPRVFYRCCQCKELFKAIEIQLNHRVPVGPTPGSKWAPPSLDWNTFIERLFCSPDNLEAICKPCHSAITKAGNAEMRAAAAREYDNAG